MKVKEARSNASSSNLQKLKQNFVNLLQAVSEIDNLTLIETP